MRHKRIVLLTLVLTLAAATALVAQDTSTMTGKVTNVDTSAGTITLTTAGGGSETLSTDSQSMYMSGGRTVTLNRLKVGDQATITYRTDNGNKVATHVDVVSTNSATTTPTDGTTYNSPTDGTTTGSTGSAYDHDTYDTTRRTDNTLPRTASPLPLIGLAGALFGGAALGIAGLRRLSA